MSYILDALKRADAERERGHVPGLHSQSTQLPPAAPNKASPRPSRRAGAIATAAVLLLAAAAAYWWWTGTPAAPHATAGAPAAEPAETPPAAAVSAPPSPPAEPPAPVLPILAPSVPAAPAAPTPKASVGPAEGAAPVATTATGPDSARPLADLPPQTRAALPTINVSGATYSANPEHRMLIVNGQVVREGQAIESGLVLETISPRSAVFNHNGTRFNVNY